MSTKEAHYRANRKYEIANVKQFGIKLNVKTDKDIIEYLEQAENRQGFIKEIIRRDIKRSRLEKARQAKALKRKETK